MVIRLITDVQIKNFFIGLNLCGPPLMTFGFRFSFFVDLFFFKQKFPRDLTGPIGKE